MQCIAYFYYLLMYIQVQCMVDIVSFFSPLLIEIRGYLDDDVLVLPSHGPVSLGDSHTCVWLHKTI